MGNYALGVPGTKRGCKCNPAKSSGVAGVRELKLDVWMDGIVPFLKTVLTTEQ